MDLYKKIQEGIKMFNMKEYKFWFVTGSQHLYGEETLEQVDCHSKKMVEGLEHASSIPGKVVWKSVVKTSAEILKVCEEANNDPTCAGIITWMHTFSPSKMWIRGLKILNKPMLHLHTQFNRDIPWDEIDMDFMNLNQSAHGDREHGFIGTRLRIDRKVVAGYWGEEKTQKRIGDWMRSAIGFQESKKLNVVRFGDNMREVAVTEGNKVSAQIQLGWSVNGYGIGDLAERINLVSNQEVQEQMDVYAERYQIDDMADEAIQYQAKIQVALQKFLEEYNAGAFTTTFEDLHGLKQLPGLACQDLMNLGYGFGAEGDWKTSAMTRIMKIMASGLKGGTTFMEDYTYNLEPGNELILGAHMLEVCPTVAFTTPRIEVHPLGIGGKNDPARIVFDGAKGDAIQVTLIDLGDRFRMIVNDVKAVEPVKPMPKLPVARVMWKPLPNFTTAAEAWILSGGAHHTVLSYVLTAEHMRDFAEMAGIEFIYIGAETNIADLKRELLYNDVIWKLK